MPRAGHKHISKRKQQPNSFIGAFIFVIAVAEPLANLPQIFTIFYHRNAAGVSITSWFLYLFFALNWLWYGLITKQKPIVVGACLFILTDGTVALGAILFGGKIL